METGSPRKIQFTMPLLDSHLDPEAAEQIRRRRPTPATLIASSDQSSPEIDEDRLPNQLYKAALLNSPRQRRKGQKGNPTMKELQFMVEHHLCLQQQQQQQQQGGAAGDECSSDSCLSDRPSPGGGGRGGESGEEEEEDGDDGHEDLPHDDHDTAEAFEKLRCQMEEFSRESLSEGSGGLDCPLSKEKEERPAVAVATASQQNNNSGSAPAAAAASAGLLAEREKTKKVSLEK